MAGFADPEMVLCLAACMAFVVWDLLPLDGLLFMLLVAVPLFGWFGILNTAY